MSQFVSYIYPKQINFMAKLIYLFLGIFKMKQKTEQNIVSDDFSNSLFSS